MYSVAWNIIKQIQTNHDPLYLKDDYMPISAFNYCMKINALLLCINMRASAPAPQTPQVLQKNPAYEKIEKLRKQLSALPAPSLFPDPENNHKKRQDRQNLINAIAQIKVDWVKAGNKLVHHGHPAFYPGEIPEYIDVPYTRVSPSTTPPASVATADE